MGSNAIKIKSRIASVTGAYKVTSAMKLVSTVKLKKWKNKMLDNKKYADEIYKTTDYLLSYSKENSIFSSSPDSSKDLYILYSSTLGLCGSYNNNIFKVGDQSIKQNDDAIIIGKKGLAHYQDQSFKHVELFNDENEITTDKLASIISEYVLKEFKKGTYRSIHIIYSSYKNSLTFIPKDEIILPLAKKEDELVGYGPILEPNEETLINTLVPFYVKTLIYSKLLESEVCEHAARSNAMENATNNAKELLDNLNLEFNKERQSSITNEIIEIVSAANSI